MRGLIIAAPRSGAGKTTVSLGLMRALSRRGFRVQPFKCGPDYIDPSFHAIAAGRTSFNLDRWAMDPALIHGIIEQTGADADLAIVEGVMGLYDASGASTAALAWCTGWPVLLVIDVTGQGETAAAVALGLRSYSDNVSIAGVILNRVASDRHLSLVKAGFARTDIPLLGSLRRDEGIQIRERHLGLVQAAEQPGVEQQIERIASTIDGAVDLAAIAAATRPARRVDIMLPQELGQRLQPPGQRIALASDVAFSFMYPHILQQWRDAGAEIVPFSPLADEAPDPGADAVWLPGGYPELHVGTLAAASRFKAGLAALAASVVPIHGECGGYMVLGQGLIDAEGNRHAMTGLLALETSFAERKLHLGYRTARVLAASALGKAGSTIRGHEFHYATAITVGDEPLVACKDAFGATIAETGSHRGSVSGTFFHMIDFVYEPSE